MDLSQFTSLFELIAAFNFAYALADTFTTALNEKILSTFRNVRANLTNIKGKIEVGRMTLYETKPVVNNGRSSESRLQECKDGVIRFEDELSELNKRLDRNFALDGLTLSFKYLCFYCALYAIFVLVPIGFLKQEPPLILNSCSIKLALFIANLITIGFQVYWIREDRIGIQNDTIDKSKIGYRVALFSVLKCIAVGVVVYFLNFYLLGWSWDNVYLDTILIFLTLLACTIHFIYYFYRAYRNAKVKGAAYRTEVQEFEDRYDQWYKMNAEAWLSFHEYFQKAFGVQDVQKPNEG